MTYLKALVDGDEALMDSILTDDFVAHDRNSAKIGGRRSRAETVAFAAAVPSLFKERLRFEYESVTAEGEPRCLPGQRLLNAPGWPRLQQRVHFSVPRTRRQARSLGRILRQQTCRRLSRRLLK